MSCKHNEEMIGNKLCGARGIDDTVPPCPVCGQHPIRVDYLFNIKNQKRMNRKKNAPVVRERRTYYYCPCGENITEWIEPLYNDDGEVTLPAPERARAFWILGTHRVSFDLQEWFSAR